VQNIEDKAVTATDESGDKSENQNLVSGLFFECQIDADLKFIIEVWS